MIKTAFFILLSALAVLPAHALAGPGSYYWKLENLERYVYPSGMELLSWREIWTIQGFFLDRQSIFQ